MNILHLPDDVIRTIVDRGSLKQAGILKTVSKDLKRVVEESKHNTHLPVKPPDYARRGTGKYQEKYDYLESIASAEHGAFLLFSLRELVTLRMLLTTYIPGKIMREIQFLRNTLDWCEPHIYAMLEHAKRLDNGYMIETIMNKVDDITDDEENMHGPRAFDALVLALYDVYGAGDKEQHVRDEMENTRQFVDRLRRMQ